MPWEWISLILGTIIFLGGIVRLTFGPRIMQNRRLKKAIEAGVRTEELE